LKIALIAGGTSSEREVALKGAEAVKRAFESLEVEYELFDPADDLLDLVKRVDEFNAAFILLHGPGGEDGSIQGFLDTIGLAYQGAGVVGSALAIHKGVSKELYKSAGLLVPEGKCFLKKELDQALEFAKSLGFPVIVKPATQGSSIGLSIVKSESELKEACERVWEIDEEVLIEEYIKGREITVGVLGEEVLPVVEIIPKHSEFFDYESKYTPGMTEEVCPAQIEESLSKLAQQIGLKAHRVLRLRDYSRTDMILTEDGKIYVLETNTIPGMTETSLLPLAARVAGYSFEELVKTLLEFTLKRAYSR